MGKLVGLGRFELPTYGLGNRRSIHLSYSPIHQQACLVYTRYVNGRPRARSYCTLLHEEGWFERGGDSGWIAGLDVRQHYPWTDPHAVKFPYPHPSECLRGREQR
jgi:hypothetical protein